jgi:ABC-2 type transport system permease protein
MTALEITVPAAAPPGSHRLAQFARVLRAEFCKLWTVRATWWGLTSVLVFNIATAVLLGIFLPSRLSAHDKATLDSVRVSLGGLHLSQVAIGLLGVLVITSEYGSGMIRATLAAVPQRRLMLAAKTLTFAAAATVTGLAASFAAYLLFQAFLPAGDGMRTALSDPGVLRAVTGAGLYLAVLGLFGLGLGTILRSSAGAVAALLGILFVPTILISLLPGSWQHAAGRYLPMGASEVVYSVQHQPYTLSPWTGFGVFCGYAAAALIAGFVLISYRDA